MNATELVAQFRRDVLDTEAPYLWSDEEVWLYATDAYKMFTRLIGGIADNSSDHTLVQVSAGEMSAELSPLILHIRGARRLSDGAAVRVINSDFSIGVLQISQGKVAAIQIGSQKDAVYFDSEPLEDDTIRLAVYRLPDVTVLKDGDELSEIGLEHHLHLINWMKALAYSKHDVETHDAKKAETYKIIFQDYCAFAKREWGRFKHTPQSIAYGGL